MFKLEQPANNNQFDLIESKKIFTEIVEDPNVGFYKIVNDQNYLEKTSIIYQQFKNKKTIFHIGIGGSSLGPLMLIQALNKSNNKFVFINNVDADQIYQQLQNIILEESVFYFVSKSGGTAETISALIIISDILKNDFNIKEEDFHKYFIFCTDPKNGDLRSLGKKLNISMLDVPQNIGGRFSVLTHVGLLPALFAHINIQALWNGAQNCQKWINESDDFYNSAHLICELKENGVDQTVLMPYSSKLKEFSSWFVQLWAESLGKKMNRDGKVVNTGLTPIPAYGATDQHSQMQLFMEGPYNKLLMLIEIDNFDHDYLLSSNFSGKSFERLNKQNLTNLYKAELHGTLKALENAKRPYMNFKINRLNEETIGELIMYCQCLTALTGCLINVDPFDQPGVEAGKIYAYQFLEESI